MMRFTIALALAATFTAGGDLHAQEAGTDTDAQVRQELRTMISGEGAAAATADDRAVIRDFLQRDDVAQAARAHGLDLERAGEGVQALSDTRAAKLADRILEAEGDLAGGDTVVITGTTIIIILLILLLIEI